MTDFKAIQRRDRRCKSAGREPKPMTQVYHDRRFLLEMVDTLDAEVTWLREHALKRCGLVEERIRELEERLATVAPEDAP